MSMQNVVTNHLSLVSSISHQVYHQDRLLHDFYECNEYSSSEQTLLATFLKLACSSKQGYAFTKEMYIAL